MPKLQSLDILLYQITWRERFVAVCMQDCTLEQRKLVLGFSASHLGGLRWQVITEFCQAVSQLISQICLASSIFTMFYSFTVTITVVDDVNVKLHIIIALMSSYTYHSFSKTTVAC